MAHAAGVPPSALARIAYGWRTANVKTMAAARKYIFHQKPTL